jgi:hypothetical protein
MIVRAGERQGLFFFKFDGCRCLTLGSRSCLVGPSFLGWLGLDNGCLLIKEMAPSNNVSTTSLKPCQLFLEILLVCLVKGILTGFVLGLSLVVVGK